MVRAALLGFVLLIGAAASTAAASRRPLFDEAELVTGAALELPQPAALVAVPTSDDAFALDDEMQDFVAPLKELRDPRQRMVALINAMEERGMFSLDYAEVTRTASGTFRDRQGNCLSFTMLFVALARAADLRATYQTVEVPPTWAHDGTVVIASHINTVVRTGGREETVVDFNVRPYQLTHRSRSVDDAYVLGLFYTNLGAEAMLRNDYAASLVFLRAAAAAHTGVAGLWVNLGVLYARHKKFEHAEAAYLRALEIERDEPSALANLALVYDALGESQLAAEYRERVQSYRELNPYYHFALATQAYEQQQFAAALAPLRKALRLKPDEQSFYALRGQVLTALGKSREATRSFELAREYARAEQQGAQSPVALGGVALR